MKKKSPRGKKSRRLAEQRRIKVWLAVLFVLGFLLMALVGLSHLRRQVRPLATSAPRPAASPAVSAPYPETTEKPLLEEIRVEIESALVRNGIQLQNFEVRPQGDLILFLVRSDFPAVPWVEDLTRRLQGIVPGVHVQSDPVRRMIGVAWEGERPFLLRFHPPVPVPVPEPEPERIRVAIIMDDLGRDRRFAAELAKIPLPVTFSILPNERHAAWTAALAHEAGREVMIHLPMQPRNYPEADPGSDALMVDLSAPELLSRLGGYFDRVPHAVGGNNHMGSLFVEDRQRMELVLSDLKRRGLFFIDSLTTPRSTGYLTAKQLGMPVAVRDVFLDNEQNVGRIGRQIDHLIAVAGKKGRAVGICHPYPETLEALRRSVERFRAKGVEVVGASRVLEREPAPAAALAEPGSG
ncbi:MAG: divergent polysaccharide deacetylase family protein [Deltaproteobacteria bacterium]|nr:divergent polysaccharide deacetylase family protein [Deltaproteobacteria bacterium]